MSEPTDQIRNDLLVLACREGRSDAFRALVARWQEPLWRHAFRLTGRDDVAWDVLQEAWLSIARGITRLAEPSSFRRWAFTIVTRRAADWARQRRDGVVSVEDVGDAAQLAVPGPEQDEDLLLLRTALRKLPRDDRVLLSLHHIDGFEGAELAEILGVPAGTVKSRLFHARRKLRDIIERMKR